MPSLVTTSLNSFVRRFHRKTTAAVPRQTSSGGPKSRTHRLLSIVASQETKTETQTCTQMPPPKTDKRLGLQFLETPKHPSPLDLGPPTAGDTPGHTHYLWSNGDAITKCAAGGRGRRGHPSDIFTMLPAARPRLGRPLRRTASAHFSWTANRQNKKKVAPFVSCSSYTGASLALRLPVF